MKLNYNGITVSVIKTYEDWHKISNVWNEIWENSPGASVFNSFQFLSNCWKCYLKKDSSLFILMLHDENNRPIGLAPFIFRHKRIFGFSLKILVFIYQPGLSDRPQFLFSHRRKEQLKAIFRFLRDNQSDWHILELTEQVVDTEYEDALSDIFQYDKRYHMRKYRQLPQPYSDIDTAADTWEKYLTTRSKNHRKKWRNKNNRLSKIGKITLTRHVDNAEIPDSLQEYLELEKKSWKRGQEAALDQDTFEFYLKLSDKIFPEGGLHVLLLRRNCIPIAGHIGLAFRNRYAGLQSVFDEAYHSFSPGFLIGGHDIKWVIENGFVEYDFMTGFLSDKLSWTDTIRENSFIRVIRKYAWCGTYYLAKFYIIPNGLRLMALLGIDRYSAYRNHLLEAPYSDESVGNDHFNDKNLIG